jgi:hypothetical protein
MNVDCSFTGDNAEPSRILVGHPHRLECRQAALASLADVTLSEKCRQGDRQVATLHPLEDLAKIRYGTAYSRPRNSKGHLGCSALSLYNPGAA